MYRRNLTRCRMKWARSVVWVKEKLISKIKGINTMKNTKHIYNVLLNANQQRQNILYRAWCSQCCLKWQQEFVFCIICSSQAIVQYKESKSVNIKIGTTMSYYLSECIMCFELDAAANRLNAQYLTVEYNILGLVCFSLKMRLIL
jgi:hypothetical protein